MLSLEHLRKIDPRLEKLTDEQLEGVRAKLYDLGQLAFETWNKERNVSIPVKIVPNYPFRVMPSPSVESTIRA